MFLRERENSLTSSSSLGKASIMRETFLSFLFAAMRSSFALAKARPLLKTCIAVDLSFQRSNYIVLVEEIVKAPREKKAFCIPFPA